MRGRLRRRKTSVGPRRRPRNNLIHLPQEIILNILSRLPFESVLECRQVCKTWRNLPILCYHLNQYDNTYFADMHLRQQPRQFQRHYEYNHHHHNNQYEFDSETKTSFVFLGLYNKLYYVGYEDNDDHSFRTNKEMNLSLPGDIWSVVGSCNGLICFSIQLKLFVNDPVYICNPITREFVHLPRFMLNNEHKFCFLVQGFGYHPSTNEYKVVRIYYCVDQRPFIGQVQVYTLGSGIGWRSKGEITHGFLQNRHGVYLNGALHWLSREGNIVAFDLADEEFRCLPTPPWFSPNWYMKSIIWVLGGWLCFVKQRTLFTTDIWLLKRNMEKRSMSSHDDDMKEQVHQSWSWCREYTINMNDIGLISQPFAITKSGEILLIRENYIVRCDPETTAEPKILGYLDMYEHGTQSAVKHFNSFVSLKALGENAERL